MTSTGGRVAAAIVAVAMLATGCGGAPGGEVAAAPGPASAFPVTVEHAYGSTTIPAEPKRVVSLGYQEHDFLLALGVTPAAVRWWYGPQDDVIYPWAEDKAAGAEPEILVMETVNLERVAALQPDLIVGVYAGFTEDEFRQLSRIAPTVSQPAGAIDYGTPWQETTKLLGRAVGRSAEADHLVRDLDARFEAVRTAHPEFAGRSVVVASYGPDSLGYFAAEDPRSRFFTSLGFEVPADLNDMTDLFYGELSFEQTGLLDRDLLIWDQLSFTPGGRSTVEQDALVQQLAVSRDGRSLFLEGDVESAFGWNTVLSLPFVLDALEPQLAAVPAPAE